jgi:hypothetical protein
MATNSGDMMEWWRVYLPVELRDVEPERPEGTDLAIWRSNAAMHVGAGGKPFSYGFQGAARKPAWNYTFKDDAHRERFIAERIASRREHFARKGKAAAERKAHVHSFVVGDVLYSSWGYDQTNVDFYQVIEVPSGKSVVIRQIGKASAPDDPSHGGIFNSSNHVTPDVGHFIGAPMLKRVTPYGSVHLTSYSSAGKWSGRPVYETDSRAGH